MSLEIGQTIKRLRKERNLTQEELAEQLNVTAQAVSKWENGTGMPDILQIVPLASVFGTSTDVLFGTYGTDDNEEVQKIIDKVNEPLKINQYKDEEEHNTAEYKAYESLQEALQRYPNNIRLLVECLGFGSNLAIGYHFDGDSRADALFIESVREATSVINYGKDMGDIMYARMWLVRLYSAYGDAQKATEHANAFPLGFNMNRGAMLAWIKRSSGDTDEEIKQRCANIESLLRAIETELMPLGNAYRKKEQYDDAIRVYKSIFGIIQAVYADEEYTPPLHVLGWLHGNLASCYVKLGDTDSAIFWLNKLLAFSLTQAKYYNKQKQLETPLLRGYIFEFFGNDYHTKKIILNDLNRPNFDTIREDARFKALLDRVNAL
jgi:transcriptional regulator with XRE-family HTH domain